MTWQWGTSYACVLVYRLLCFHIQLQRVACELISHCTVVCANSSSFVHAPHSKIVTFKHRAWKHMNLCNLLDRLTYYMLKVNMNKHDIIIEWYCTYVFIKYKLINMFIYKHFMMYIFYAVYIIITYSNVSTWLSNHHPQLVIVLLT